MHFTVAARTVQWPVVVPAAQMSRPVAELFQAARGQLGLGVGRVSAGPHRMLRHVVVGCATPMILQQI